MASGDQVVSLKRLKKEYKQINDSPPAGVSVSLPSDTDLYVWEALLNGPEDSEYKGGVFKARVCVPVNYPMKPPEVHFVFPLPYHLNVSQSSGQVCLGLLGVDKWEPSYMGMEHILQALVAILIRPEPSSAMDHEVLNNYHNFSLTYAREARSSASNAAITFNK